MHMASVCTNRKVSGRCFARIRSVCMGSLGYGGIGMTTLILRNARRGPVCGIAFSGISISGTKVNLNFSGAGAVKISGYGLKNCIKIPSATDTGSNVFSG